MSIRYYEQPSYQRLPFVRALFAANMLFAVAVLVAWQSAIIALIAPLTWAVNDTVTFERDFWQILQYPLVFFWAGPAFAMATGWMLVQSRHYRTAFGVLVTPMLVVGLTFVMYWIVPDAGR